MTIDFKAVNAALAAQIDVASEMLYANDKPREHLGASVIGEDCAAKVWFSFRWAKTSFIPGRILRLFNTGHREEARFIEWFETVGFEVSGFTPEGDQHRIKGASGHFGGSLDSLAVYRGNPKIQNEFSKTLEQIIGIPVILEYKTHNKKSYDNMLKHGLKISKWKHFTQMSTYAAFHRIDCGIYAAYCKDDDRVYPEMLPMDWSLAGDMVRKAEDIIQSKQRPARISENPTYFECKQCTYSDICHDKAPMQKNCRSCRHADAADGQQWYCGQWGKNIPKDFIPVGCDWWAQVDV